MAKSKKPVYYAVRIGREGPKIYNTWDECLKNTNGHSGSRHKSFPKLEDAQAWILATDSAQTPQPLPMPSGASTTTATMPIMQSSPSPPPSNRVMTAPTAQTRPSRMPVPIQSPAPNSFDLGVDYIPLEEKAPLSEEQREILDLVRSGRSLFFTGSAGTGKSYLLKAIIADLTRGEGRREKVAITASTGIASVNIGGATVHSFSGVGFGKENIDILLRKVIKNKQAVKRWRAIRTLIIDEISMIDGSLFDKLEHIARVVRDSDKPFGGIQLVVCGDFFQLPPVPDQHDGAPLPVTFAFDAKSWKRCILEMHTLTKVFRQDDQALIDILNDMREGRLRGKSDQILRGLSRDIGTPNGLEPTELFPLRAQVEKANGDRLRELPGPDHVYTARDYPGYDIRCQPIPQEKATELLNRTNAPPQISLRLGAQVMLIQNLVQGRLVNGTKGKVVNFLTTGAARRQLVEIAKLDDKKAAWSAPALDPVEGVDSDSTPPPDDEEPGVMKWPVVEFEGYGKLLLPPMGFTVVSVFGEMEAQRDQVPLILAWALSIHKSQGQTLDPVKVDLEKVFEKGQMYVALSRAKSLGGLRVLNYNPSRVMAHPRVIEWSKSLRSLRETPSPAPAEEEIEPEAPPASSYMIRSKVVYDSFASEFDGDDAMEAYPTSM